MHMIISQEKSKSAELTVILSWFFTYCFLGWIYETMYCSCKAGHYVSRGFLYGPFIPIYGLCIVSAVLLLSERAISKISLFLICALIATVLEYLTSLWMEFVFGRRWWDYSHKLLNINGRVCLEASVVFGLLGVLIIKYVHPNLIKLMNYYVTPAMIKKITRLVLLIFVLDVLMSFARSL